MTQSDDGQSLVWIEGLSALEELAPEWCELANRTGADIYLTPDWILTWWDHFGEGRGLRALVARREDGELSGLLPFMTENLWGGRIARLAATDPQCVIFRCPVEDGLLPRMLSRAMADLLHRQSKIQAVSFTPASERGQLLEAMYLALIVAKDRSLAASNETKSSKHVRQDCILLDRPAGTHSVFELPESFDTYLSSLSKKRRSQFRRDLRTLKKTYCLTSRASHPDEHEFRDFVTFHNRQWQEVAKGGYFTDWPGSKEFFCDLAGRSRDLDHVSIDWQDGLSEPLAAQFCLVSGDTWHWRLPARAMSPDMERLSVGRIGLVLLIKRLIELGVTRIEAGVGSYGYKLVYGAEAVPLHQLIVMKNTRLARLQLLALLAGARVLHLGYYRLWFGRIAPSIRKVVPFRHRALWKSWIRTRL